MVTLLACKVLHRFLSLLVDIKVLLIEKGQPASHYEDASCECDLAFLTNI
jgi:hypothetical protein